MNIVCSQQKQSYGINNVTKPNASGKSLTHFVYASNALIFMNTQKQRREKKSTRTNIGNTTKSNKY